MKRGQQVFCTPSDHAPKIISEWTGIYSDESRLFQGVASIASTKGNKLWAVWYGGGAGEGPENYVMVSASSDMGRSWEKKFIIDSDVRCSGSNVWLDPTNTLWISWGQYPNGVRGPGSVNYRVLCANPDSADAKFTAPEPFSSEVSFNKPTVLSNGRWLLQGSIWQRTTENSRSIYSDDQGETFYYGADIVLTCPREFDEYMTVERNDKSVWLMTRTMDGLGEAVSYDRGETFSPVAASEYKHITSRFHLSRLPSDRLLWIRHGYPHERLGDGPGARYNLMAFLAEDDGKTWIGGLSIDRRVGVAYPDATVVQGGTIYVIYDYDRLGEKEILVAEITEDRIVNCDGVDTSELLLVNKALGATVK